MEVPLPVVLVDHSGLLQKVVDDVASHGGALPPGRRPEREGGGGRGGRAGRGEGEAGVLRRDVGLISHAGTHFIFQHKPQKRG